MHSTTNQLEQTPSEVEATWLRQRSDSELRNFIEQRHDSLSDDLDLAFDGLF